MSSSGFFAKMATIMLVLDDDFGTGFLPSYTKQAEEEEDTGSNCSSTPSAYSGFRRNYTRPIYWANGRTSTGVQYTKWDRRRNRKW